LKITGEADNDVTRYSSKVLQSHYQDLKPGDIIVGEVASAHENTAVLIDLLQRGVVCIPSALAQVLSRSKVAQVDLLGQYMLPLTMAVKRRSDLMAAMKAYTAAGIGSVVTKEQHMHCGHGVRRWDHIEMVYSFMGLENNSYPFVLQPLAENFVDVRTILVGDYVEAYTRSNPYSFRRNLCAGGRSSPYELSREQMQFCRNILKRAHFPYAHLDIQIMPDGRVHIFEIALNGGIQGSRIERSELDRLKAARLDQLAEMVHNLSPAWDPEGCIAPMPEQMSGW
jgi:ribosomal protein S6--L-glutamate ligase